MAQGLTVSAIARRVRLDRKTVRRFANAEVAADLLGPHGRRATALDPHLLYLATRWREGQHVAAFLFDEICGFSVRRDLRRDLGRS
jgi:DNA-binding IclR family transcriptional regulator